MLISAGLRSKVASLTATIGTVQMLSRVSADYSQRVLFATTSNVGVKLRIVKSSKAEVVGQDSGFDLTFRRIFYGSETKLSGRFLFIHHYVKTSNRSRIIYNGPLMPVTSTHFCSGCYLAPVT
jgi:hypothetical protein